jgi:hypothetical protein
MGEKGHNTNLAAEFHVLSMLYRMGANANLTLGNKKSVDIVVIKNGKILTIDVKGLKDASCFPIDNCFIREENHFLVFVSFVKKINDPKVMPEIYIVPSSELDETHEAIGNKAIVYKNPKGNRTVVELGRLRKLKDKYHDKWDYFV